MRRIIYTLFFLLASLFALIVSTDEDGWKLEVVAKIAPPLTLVGLPILVGLTIFLVVFIFKNHWGLFFIGLLIVGFSWVNVTGYNSVYANDKVNLKIATINLLWNNANHYEDAKNKISSLNPDVVILQEYYKETDLARITDLYPYVSEITPFSKDFSEIIIMSRYPFASEGSFKTGSRSVPISSIFVNGKTIGIMGVHTVSPTDKNRVDSWLNDLEGLSNTDLEKYDGFIMAGDFNANMTMKPFRNMINSNNLRVVNNYRPTWGTDIFKFGLIDNVLVSEKIYLKKFSVENIMGSDHALTYAELYIS